MTRCFGFGRPISAFSRNSPTIWISSAGSADSSLILSFSVCVQKQTQHVERRRKFSRFFIYFFISSISLILISCFLRYFVTLLLFLRQHNVRVDLVIQWPTEWIGRKKRNQEEEFEKKLSILFLFCFDISNAKWWMFWEFVQRFSIEIFFFHFFLRGVFLILEHLKLFLLMRKTAKKSPWKSFSEFYKISWVFSFGKVF